MLMFSIFFLIGYIYITKSSILYFITEKNTEYYSQVVQPCSSFLVLTEMQIHFAALVSFFYNIAQCELVLCVLYKNVVRTFSFNWTYLRLEFDPEQGEIC